MNEPEFRPLFKDGPIFNYNSKAFSLCTDSILLADFAICNNVNIKRFAELGCGSGAVSLLFSHRFPNSEAALLDISENAIAAATENFAANSMAARARFLLSDVSDIRKTLECERFELVISNPPYFNPERGKASPDFGRNQSRHGRVDVLADFFSAASYLLKAKGSFCFVMRTDRLAETIALLKSFKLEPKKLRMIHDKSDSKSKIFLMEAKKNAAPGMTALPPLILRNADGSLSHEHLGIYRIYNLNES